MPDKIISTAKSILNLTKYRVKRGHQKRPLQAKPSGTRHKFAAFAA
jgi:hypothetical protein